jgi:hypothetical protein
MTSLLGHGEANEISSLLCALEHGHAERQTRECKREMRLFVQRSGEEKRGSGVAGHWTDGIVRKQRVCIVQMRVSPVQFLTCSVTASGLLRRPAAGSLFCFDSTTPSHNNRVPGPPDFIALRVTVSICDGPSVNAELRPWESRPLA